MEKHTVKRQRKDSNYAVIGFDTETLQGPPITLQFYSDDVSAINGCVFIGKRRAIDCMLHSLSKLPSGRYRMYGHNLEFDMLSALWEVKEQIRDGNIDLSIGDWSIQGRYSKPIFAVFNDGKRYVELIDSFLWFMTSLARAADLVCPDLPKLQRPVGLGETLYKSTDKKFIAYAMRDAEVAFFLGKAIERFHDELNVPAQISLASMAAAVFRLHYMDSNIFQPPTIEWMAGSAASYHGGVNRVKTDAAPAWHMNVSALDISSAYPHAMTELPRFDSAKLYKRFKPTRKAVDISPLGVYCISGSSIDCDWPALFDHKFKPLIGRFENIWVNGFELREAIKSKEVKITRMEGVYYTDTDTTNSPFPKYAHTFYALKSSADDPIMRYMYKILLNALTGKFIQTSPDFTMADGRLVKIRRAGGLYHPFIASAITAHTRARIHQLEHMYGALHTATDGIFVPGNVAGDKQKVLGAVVNEGFGNLALFRNKLYIFYSQDQGFDSQVFKGQKILKAARHGFQGSITDLEQMLLSNKREYKTNKPLKLKTALKQGDNPNKFVTQVRMLRNVDSLRVITHDNKVRKTLRVASGRTSKRRKAN